jgi:hypothetical protein
MATFLDGGVLGRKAECVVPDRPQNGVPAAATEVRDDVPERVVQDVAHVELTRGVGEHLQHVRLLVGIPATRRFRIGNRKSAFALPDALPFTFDRFGVVPLHFSSSETKKPLFREAAGESSSRLGAAR